MARDDVLDALVAAVSAKLGMNRLGVIPATAEYDSKGLRMEIVYPVLGSACLKKVPSGGAAESGVRIDKQVE